MDEVERLEARVVSLEESLESLRDATNLEARVKALEALGDAMNIECGKLRRKLLALSQLTAGFELEGE